MNRWFIALCVGLAGANAGFAQEHVMQLTVAAGKHAYDNVPVCVPLSVAADWSRFGEVVVDVGAGKDATKLVGQLTAPSITTESIKPTKEGFVRRDLHVVLPRVSANQDSTLVVHFKPTSDQGARFVWTARPGEYDELSLKRPAESMIPMLRYMDRPYDVTSPEARNKSYKVFHHLYDPAGKRFVTNGGFTNDNVSDPKKLLYPHHRGIMYGFNKCTYGPNLKNKADTWHCTGDAHVAHEKTLLAETGPVIGRHRVLLGWFGEKNERFAEEERELTVYHLPGGTLVEFASRLKTTGGKVHVDGDPQHAGFQFRAANDVAEKSKKQTYYLHPDGKGEMGKERNWPQDKAMVDLPWYVLSFVLDGQRYSVCYLNSPSNPKETRFSERDYGRFGGYFVQDVTKDHPLVVNYRLWLQNGEMTPQQAEALRTAFATPPQAMPKGAGN